MTPQSKERPTSPSNPSIHKTPDLAPGGTRDSATLDRGNQSTFDRWADKSQRTAADLPSRSSKHGSRYMSGAGNVTFMSRDDKSKAAESVILRPMDGSVVEGEGIVALNQDQIKLDDYMKEVRSSLDAIAKKFNLDMDKEDKKIFLNRLKDEDIGQLMKHARL